jgi:uncharacterized protein (TIGR03067 family)
MRAVLGALAVLLAAPAATAQDVAALAGVWTAVAAERDGGPAADVVGHVLSFEGDAFAIVGRDGALLYGGTFAVDAAASPPTIDFVNVEGEAAGQTWEGIWRLDGATLTIADDAPDPARARPATFAAPAGSGVVLVTFERAGG